MFSVREAIMLKLFKVVVFCLLAAKGDESVHTAKVLARRFI